MVVDNNSGDPIIPAATLGLESGDGITVTDKSIAIDFRTETNNPLEVSGTGAAAGLSLNIDEDGPLQKTTNGLDVILESQGGLGIGSLSSGIQIQRQTNSGIAINATGITAIDLDDTSGLQLGAGGLSIDLDGVTGLNLAADGLSILTSSTGGLNVGGLSNGLEVLLPSDSGLQTDATGLSLNAGIDELTDVVLQTGDDAPTDGQVLTFDGTNWQNEALPASTTTLSALTDVTLGTLTDGQILEYDSDTSMWVNTTLSGGGNFTAGTGLSFNADSTVLNTDGNMIEYSSVGVEDGDLMPTVADGTTREVAIGTGTKCEWSKPCGDWTLS